MPESEKGYVPSPEEPGEEKEFSLSSGSSPLWSPYDTAWNSYENEEAPLEVVQGMLHDQELTKVA